MSKVKTITSIKVRQFFDLVKILTLRDIKVRYKLSILGIYWAILNPLLMALVWGFVFSKIFRAQGIDGIPYLVFIFCGITFWGLFSNSLYTSVNSLTGNATMLSKVSFPRIILPTSAVIARLVDFGFSFLVIVLLLIFFRIPLHSQIIWLPLLLFLHLLFTLGMSFIVSSLNVLYRDISQIINIVLMLWMYVSPIFYTIDQIPDDIRKYFLFNPIGQLVHMEVEALLGGVGPDLKALFITCVLSIVTFFIGIFVFKHYEDYFAEVM